MVMMVKQEHSNVLQLQCPDGCTVVYYIKQLSPSDAACSKQIKLPKTEARRFVGDLRHKQRSLVTVIDHHRVMWEFLCTCYGCQYALSRVAVFCNTYKLCAGQYLMFYRDALKQLRISVSPDVPEILRQHFSIGSRGALQRRLSHVSPPPALQPAAAAAYDPAAAAAAAADYGAICADQTALSSQVTLSPGKDSNLSTDDLRRSSSSSGIDSDQSAPASQASRDSSSDHLAAAAAAVDSVVHDSRSWDGQAVFTNAAASCSSRQQLQQMAPAAVFGSSSGATPAELQQQVLLLQASGLLPAAVPFQQQHQQQGLLSSGRHPAAAAATCGSRGTVGCALVCHEELLESPTPLPAVWQLHSKQQQQQQQFHRDQSRPKADQQPAAAAANTGPAAAAAAALRDVSTKSCDQGKAGLSADAGSKAQLLLQNPLLLQPPQHQQHFTFKAARGPKPILNLDAAAVQPLAGNNTAAYRTTAAARQWADPSSVVQTAAAAAAAARTAACGSKRGSYEMTEPVSEPASKRQHTPAHQAAATAAAVAWESAAGTTAAATAARTAAAAVTKGASHQQAGAANSHNGGSSTRLLRPGCTVWPAEGASTKLAVAGSSSSSTKAGAGYTNSTTGTTGGGAAAAPVSRKVPLMQNYNYCNVANSMGHGFGRQQGHMINCESSSSSSYMAKNACTASVYLSDGGCNSCNLPAYHAWQPQQQQQQQQRAAAAGGGTRSERVFHTGTWQSQQQLLWANIYAHYGSSCGSRNNAVAAEQVLPLFRGAAHGAAAAAAAADVGGQHDSETQGRLAAQKTCTAASPMVSASAAPGDAACAAAATGGGGGGESSSVAAPAAAAPTRMAPPKQLYKQQQQQKLLQQQGRCIEKHADHTEAQMSQQQVLQQQIASQPATQQTRAAAAAAEDPGNEWSAVCGLLMLSQN